MTEPRLLFDHFDTSQIAANPYDGLVAKRFGPYDKNYRRFSEIRYCSVASSPTKPSLDLILQNLRKGGSRGFSGGISAYFRTEITEVGSVVSEDDSTESMIASAEKLLAKSNQNFDLAYVYVPASARYILNSPYYRVKALFAQHGIPSQMVTTNTDPNNTYHLFNIAVGSYAKMGGVPWALLDGLKNIDCLLGVSFSEHVSELERITEKPRYVGFVNIFDNRGIWLAMMGTAEQYDWEEFPFRIKLLLRDSIKFYENKKGRKPKSILIHTSKKIGGREVKCVNDGLSTAYGGNYESQVRYGMIHISDDIPVRFYDISDPNRTPPRGLVTKTDDSTVFLCTTGRSEIRGARMGTPVNLRVYMKAKSPDSELNIYDIAKHVLALTKLNYGALSAVQRNPVSIAYSNELAYMTAALEHEEWEKLIKNPIAEKLKQVLWFL